LSFEDCFLFELGPQNLSIVLVFGFLQPEALLDDSSNQVAVVPPPDVHFEGVQVLVNIQLPVDPVGPIHQKQKLLVFVHLLHDRVLTQLQQVLLAFRRFAALLLGRVESSPLRSRMELLPDHCGRIQKRYLGGVVLDGRVYRLSFDRGLEKRVDFNRVDMSAGLPVFVPREFQSALYFDSIVVLYSVADLHAQVVAQIWI
jgi:hypothetical protein